MLIHNTFAQCSKTTSWISRSSLWRDRDCEKGRGRSVWTWIACTVLPILHNVLYSSPSDTYSIGCERTRVGEVEGERSVCCVVWEMVGGYRFTVVGLAEERLFKTPTQRLLLPDTLSATASHRQSPSARREMYPTTATVSLHKYHKVQKLVRFVMLSSIKKEKKHLKYRWIDVKPNEVSWLGQPAFSFHLVKLDSKQNLSHNILYWQRDLNPHPS